MKINYIRKAITAVFCQCYAILAESQYRIPVSTQKKCNPVAREGIYHIIYTSMFASPPNIFEFAIEFNREATLCCCIL